MYYITEKNTQKYKHSKSHHSELLVDFYLFLVQSLQVITELLAAKENMLHGAISVCSSLDLFSIWQFS